VTASPPGGGRAAPDDPDEPLDPGMQAERTYLSWQRTGLVVGGVGALLLHTAIDGHPPLVAPGLLTLLIAAALTARARRRYRVTITTVRLGRSPADRRVIAATAALATALCLVGLTAIVLL
jgi:uncharacterized membrane protein YidH (DUF202 family)